MEIKYGKKAKQVPFSSIRLGDVFRQDGFEKTIYIRVQESICGGDYFNCIALDSGDYYHFYDDEFCIPLRAVLSVDEM